MNMQHVIALNGRLYEVTQPNRSFMTLGTGRQRATYYPATGRLVSKHVLTGQFISTRVR